MPYRFVPPTTGQYYHVFNRGVARLPIFDDDHDYAAARLGMRYYRHTSQPMRLSYFKRQPIEGQQQLLKHLAEEPELVRLVAFTLMPNHFHLLLQQLVDGGIQTFIARWLGSYSRYFNERHERVGALFQAGFKAVPIYSTELLVHISRYLHLNLIVSGILTFEELMSSSRSSFPEYIGKPELVDPTIVLSQFSSPIAYRSFVEDHADYGRSLEQIKHLVVE